MAEINTLTKARIDVRARRAALQGDYDRIAAELTKFRAAEAALTSIVGGVPLEETGHLRSTEAPRAIAGDRAAPQQGGRRGARGPRANSAKGRLKVLRGDAGPQGLLNAEIAERLSDVAPNTPNTYLSMMLTGARRSGTVTSSPPHRTRAGIPKRPWAKLIRTRTGLKMTSLTATPRPSEQSWPSRGGRHAGQAVADICDIIGSIRALGKRPGHPRYRGGIVGLVSVHRETPYLRPQPRPGPDRAPACRTRAPPEPLRPLPYGRGSRKRAARARTGRCRSNAGGRASTGTP